MTIHRPLLSPQEVADAREAWTSFQRGIPVPTQLRPASLKVATYCLARAYEHDQVAEARPLFVHPDAQREGWLGIYGVNHRWLPTELATWIEKSTRDFRAKGTGWMFCPGHSWNGDADGAAPFPLGPRQRGDARCRELGWLVLDADAVGEWTEALDALGMHDAAYVCNRSAGHCGPPGECKLHRYGAIKWHLILPLRESWTPPENVEEARAQWKGELYPAAQFTLHVVGQLTGKGFDRQLEQMLSRLYAGAPYDRMHAKVPREIRGVEGLGFDIRACWAGLEELGVVDPVAVRAERERRSAWAGSNAWSHEAGPPPMVAAFHAANLYVRPMSNGNHAVVCPWETLHSCGRVGDTSTVLFPNGIFHCSHSHPEGKGPNGMREVFAILPLHAQEVHRASRQQARDREGSTPTLIGTDSKHENDFEVGLVGGGPVASEGSVEDLSRVLAALAEDPQCALSDSFILQASALSVTHQATLHAAVKAAGVPMRPYNGALAAAAKVRQHEAQCAADEADIERASRDKPVILVGPDEDRVADEAGVALCQHANVYQRGGVLVCVLHDLSSGAGVIRPRARSRIAVLPIASLRICLSACAVWIRRDAKGRQQRTYVPQSVVNAVCARGEWPGLRPLENVVDCPMLRPDGTAITTPGYDEATGLLYEPSEDFPEGPKNPTQADARAALAVLHDILVDFPFKTPAHLAACVAALVTPLARYSFRGPSPLFMIDANTAGTGKGRLVAVIGAIVAGRPMATMAPLEDDGEQRKRITALAIGGDKIVLIDNVVGTLGSPSLDAALTSTEWSDRLLGVTQTVRVPLAMTWYATGNNIQLLGDMGRRIMHIRLESPLDQPGDRTGFRYPDLETFVRTRRAVFVTAALTILRAFCAAGRPAAELKSWGSFEGWSDLVRGALVYAGELDPAETRGEVRSEADVALRAFQGLLEGWSTVADRYGGRCTAAQVLRELARNDAAAANPSSNETLKYEVFRDALAELIPTPPGKLPGTRHLGNTLRGFKGRVVMCSDGRRRLMSTVKECSQGVVWTVRETEGEPTSPSPDRGSGGSGGSAIALREAGDDDFCSEHIGGAGTPGAEEHPSDPPDPRTTVSPDDLGPARNDRIDRRGVPRG